MPNTQFTSRFIEDTPTTDPTDLGVKYVTKEYMMDVYPELVPNMKATSAWISGANTYGQAGDGTTNNLSTTEFTKVGQGSTNWKSIACGAKHFYGIKNDGTMWVAGDNSDFGELGLGNNIDQLNLVQSGASANDWLRVTAGDFVPYAWKTDGRVFTCGKGNVGDNTLGTTNVWTQINGAGTDWKEIDISQVNSTCYGLKTDGRLYGWGWTGTQLGNGLTGINYAPVEITGGPYISAAQGASMGHVIKSDGSMWAVGTDFRGSTGLGVADNSVNSFFQRIGSGNDWKIVRNGIGFGVAMKTDGTLWHWGNYLNIAPSNVPTLVPGSSPSTLWKDIQCHYSTVVGIKTDGTIWGYGYNNSYQLMTGDNTNRSSLFQLRPGNNWKSIRATQYNIVAISEAEGW